MSKSVAIIYLFWSAMLIGAGFYVLRQINDLSNPSSLGSAVKNFKETIDEDSEISK